MKNLPIGIQSFSKLRTNYLYVDKTRHIYNMVSGGNIYFLSRPRRFGKSLLVSAMNELFDGNKSIFEGLYIYDKWDWNKTNPVIRIDFSTKANDTKQQLENSLTDFLNDTASKNGLKLERLELPDRFAELITKLHSSTGERVVVLIDEYDKPILDTISNKEVSELNKNTLHDFYQVLKGTDDHLRFVFMTGVSKFAGLSIFSALNNINDITLDEKYSSICGYTQEELELNFAEHIKAAAQALGNSPQELIDKIRAKYDGYSWDGKTRVYNPFSTLLFFDKREFNDYWFATGTPTFLIKKIKDESQIKGVFEPMVVRDSLLRNSSSNVGIISLLFQTGYLTIKSSKTVDDIRQYTLVIPNEEVKQALMDNLFSSYSGHDIEELQEISSAIIEQMRTMNEKGFEEKLKFLLSRIPFKLHIKKESYYHSLFLSWLAMLGFDICGEIPTNFGILDAVLKLSDLTIVAELKYSARKSFSTMLKEALKQIKSKKYYEGYTDKPVILLAIAFNGKTLKCKMEQLKLLKSRNSSPRRSASQPPRHNKVKAGKRTDSRRKSKIK